MMKMFSWVMSDSNTYRIQCLDIEFSNDIESERGFLLIVIAVGRVYGDFEVWCSLYWI